MAIDMGVKGILFVAHIGKFVKVAAGIKMCIRDRIEYVDNLKRDGVIMEDVIMQTGFSTYEPKYCKWSKLLSYKEMAVSYTHLQYF